MKRIGTLLPDFCKLCMGLREPVNVEEKKFKPCRRCARPIEREGAPDVKEIKHIPHVFRYLTGGSFEYYLTDNELDNQERMLEIYVEKNGWSF